MGFQCIMANGGGGGEGCEPDNNCKNPGALPPFPTWEGVLATEIGNPVRWRAAIFEVKQPIGRLNQLHPLLQLHCRILKYLQVPLDYFSVWHNTLA